MTSPAQRHMMRVSAAMTAQRDAARCDMQLSMSRCWLSSPQTSAH